MPSDTRPIAERPTARINALQVQLDGQASILNAIAQHLGLASGSASHPVQAPAPAPAPLPAPVAPVVHRQARPAPVAPVGQVEVIDRGDRIMVLIPGRAPQYLTMYTLASIQAAVGAGFDVWAWYKAHGSAMPPVKSKS